MLKDKFDKVVAWSKENKEIVVAGAIAVIGTAIVTSKLKNNKKEDIPVMLEEKEEIQNDMVYLYQLDDQDECWALITSDLNNLGEKTDLVEIGRQIAEGLYREE